MPPPTAHAEAEACVGTLIADRYRVQRFVARGGMAEVFEVTDGGGSQALALKRLRADVARDSRVTTLFSLEFHTLARLKHPNIIEVYDFGLDRGCPFYTMEWLAGDDLRTLAPMPAQRACALLRDVAASLALLHLRRLVHRDVSPRNVRLTADGRCKLLDFGAMAHFGPARDIVGTAPLIAPECVRGGALDQRTDLFALGALAFYVLTGRHAFPARELRELTELWRTPPPAPSAYDAAIPKALDELVLSLLRVEQYARPATAALVIDRLVAIGDLEPEGVQVGDSYVDSVQLSGRARERERLSGALTKALAGTGDALMVESNPGAGKTRLLQELAADAQLAGALVAQVDARSMPGAYGTARALCLALLRAAPTDTELAFAPYAPTLAHVLPELGVAERSLVELPADVLARRATLQSAFVQAIALICKSRPLALFVDDVEHADDLSLLLLNALAHEAPSEPLLLVGAQTLTKSLAESAALAALNRSVRHVRLHRLRHDGTADLVRNTFGNVPNVDRLAAFLHEATTGNASQLVQLMRRLIARGEVTYVGGTWVLPATMPDAEMPKGIVDALRSRTSAVAPAARTVAELLALYEAPIPIDVLAAASGMPDAELLSALDVLSAAGLCIASNDRHRLSQDALRQALTSDLAPERARQLHSQLAAALERRARSSADAEIRLGHHLIHSGSELVGARRLDAAADRLRYAGVDLAPATRAVEAALHVYERAARPWAERVRLRIKLVMWSPFTDARLVDRYGDATLAELYAHSGLATAERLHWLGRGLALALGVAWSALRQRLGPRDERGLGAEESIIGFLRALTPTIAVRAIRLDGAGVLRATRYIDSLSGFPRRHAAHAIHVYARGQREHFCGHVEQAKATFREFLALVDKPGHMRGAEPDEVRELRFAGRVALGEASMRHCDARMLEVIDRIAEDGAALGVVTEHQMRAMFHMSRGEWEPAQRSIREFDRASASVADVWQLEQIMLPFTGLVAFVMADTVGLKRIVERLRAVAKHAPSLARVERLLHFGYLAHHGRAGEAVDELEALAQATPPLTDLLWMDLRSELAFAHLRLGNFERACEVCEETFVHARGEMLLTDIGLVFCRWTWAEALLALERPQEALTLLDALLADVTATGAPLLLGRSYGLRALARRALGDVPGSESDITQMLSVHAQSGHPLLFAQSEAFLQSPAPAELHGTPPPALAAAREPQNEAQTTAHTTAGRRRGRP